MIPIRKTRPELLGSFPSKWISTTSPKHDSAIALSGELRGQSGSIAMSSRGFRHIVLVPCAASSVYSAAWGYEIKGLETDCSLKVFERYYRYERHNYYVVPSITRTRCNITKVVRSVLLTPRCALVKYWARMSCSLWLFGTYWGAITSAPTERKSCPFAHRG